MCTVQGVRAKRNVHCWVEGTAAPPAAGVELSVGLQNTGPYPVTQAWSVLVVCAAPGKATTPQKGTRWLICVSRRASCMHACMCLRP